MTYNPCMSKKPNPTISEELRQAIKASGMTSYRLGKESKTSPTVIDRFLNGQRDLRLATAAKLAAVLQLELRRKGR